MSNNRNMNINLRSEQGGRGGRGNHDVQKKHKFGGKKPFEKRFKEEEKKNCPYSKEKLRT